MGECLLLKKQATKPLTLTKIAQGTNTRGTSIACGTHKVVMAAAAFTNNGSGITCSVSISGGTTFNSYNNVSNAGDGELKFGCCMASNVVNGNVSISGFHGGVYTIYGVD